LADEADPILMLGYHWGYHLRRDTIPPDLF
jgi:hypothetical protein